MKICQVERPLVATNRIAEMEHKHLQVVRDAQVLRWPSMQSARSLAIG